jgi:hypothetical protein
LGCAIGMSDREMNWCDCRLISIDDMIYIYIYI